MWDQIASKQKCNVCLFEKGIKKSISFWWLERLTRRHFLPLGQTSINWETACVSSAHTVGWLYGDRELLLDVTRQPGCPCGHLRAGTPWAEWGKRWCDTDEAVFFWVKLWNRETLASVAGQKRRGNLACRIGSPVQAELRLSGEQYCFGEPHVQLIPFEWNN